MGDSGSRRAGRTRLRVVDGAVVRESTHYIPPLNYPLRPVPPGPYTYSLMDVAPNTRVLVLQHVDEEIKHIEAFGLLPPSSEEEFKKMAHMMSGVVEFLNRLHHRQVDKSGSQKSV